MFGKLKKGVLFPLLRSISLLLSKLILVYYALNAKSAVEPKKGLLHVTREFCSIKLICRNLYVVLRKSLNCGIGINFHMTTPPTLFDSHTHFL